MSISGTYAIRTSPISPRGSDRQQQQVGRFAGIDIHVHTYIPVGSCTVNSVPVTQHTGSRIAQYYIGIFNHLFKLLVIQVEAGSESISGLTVEVVFRHTVQVVADERQSLFDVVINLLVQFFHRTALVMRSHLRFRSHRIRQA